MDPAVHRRVWLALMLAWAPRAAPRRVEAARAVPPPEVIAGGMVRLVVACLLALAGMIWFYRFSRS